MRWLRRLLLTLFLSHASHVPPAGANPTRLHDWRFYQTGKASWYGREFQGAKTASGEPYNMYGLTAASRTLPMGSWARVTNLNNNRSVFLRINDRGPWNKRILDLSYGAAKALKISGVDNVMVEVPRAIRSNAQEVVPAY